MKKIILFIVAFAIPFIILSQKWQQTIGMPNRGENTHDIIELYDKGIFIPANYFEGKSGGWNVKSDINGYELYNKTVAHSITSVEFLSSTADKSGNIYLCGIIVLDDIWPIVVKYDSCGNNIWCRVLINDYFDFGVGKSILFIEDNKLLLLARQDMDGHIDQAVLYCLDTDGNILWSDVYASQDDHPLVDVLVVHNLHKYNNSYFIDGYCYWAYPDNPVHYYLRSMFIKIDSLFNEEWVLPFAHSDSIVSEAFYTIPISEDVYLGTGAYWENNPVEEYTFLMYFNSNGEELGNFIIPNDSIGYDVTLNFIVDIEKLNDSLFIGSTPVGYNDDWIQYFDLIIDSTGLIIDYAIRPNTDGWSNLIKTSDGNFVVAVEMDEGNGNNDILLYKIDENLQSVPFDTTAHVYDSLCPGGIQSGTIDITDCFIWTNIEDVPSPQEYYASLKKIPVKAYPNPATQGSITFKFENTEYHSDMELRCFDIIGNLVYSEKVYCHQGKSVVDVSTWQKEMYVAVMYSDGLPVGNCKFVVQ